MSEHQGAEWKKIWKDEYLKRRKSDTGSNFNVSPRPGKWVTGAYIKIGYFGDSDLRYQDEVHGPLILQADKVVELIYTKYMKALID